MEIIRRALILGERDQGQEQRWRHVASLFRQPRSLAVSGIGAVVTACVCWLHSGSALYLAWGLAGSGVLGLRLALSLRFNHNSAGLGEEAWAWLFLVGGCATATVFGAGAALTVLRSGDPIAMLYMAANVISFAGGTAVRNSASPLAALCQTTIALGLPGIACLLSGTAYLQAFAALMMLHLIAQFEIVGALGRNAVWLISAERRQASLNELLLKTCEQLEDANRRLTLLSSTDGLTGLANRRAFDAELARQWDAAVHGRITLALLMIDADHFKQFNDRHGHLAGDDALRWMAQVFKASLDGPCVLVSRFGGEEFAVLLPDTGTVGAVSAAESIRQSLARAELPEAMMAAGRLTVSIGAAAVRPTAEGGCLELVELADQALYAAKKGGRDRVAGARAPAHACA